LLSHQRPDIDDDDDDDGEQGEVRLLVPDISPLHQ
jgi:hypothetical protein